MCVCVCVYQFNVRHYPDPTLRNKACGGAVGPKLKSGQGTPRKIECMRDAERKKNHKGLRGGGLGLESVRKKCALTCIHEYVYMVNECGLMKMK